MSKLQAVRTLRNAGIASPGRVERLIRETIALLELDLSGMTVLTEAASGPYVVTPVIASLARAERVLALTRDSRYATAQSVMEQTRALENLCGIEQRAEILTQRSMDLFAEADIVTNLGFVRPICSEAVGAMKAKAVVPLMCEAWEFRPSDVDLEACRRKGIAVSGTNEDYPSLNVFAYSGWLCLRMLFDAGIEVHKSHVVVVGSDKFGRVIEGTLQTCGVSVNRVPHIRGGGCLQDTDAIVVADYTREDMIIGPSGDMTARELSNLAPGAAVIQFAGVVDLADLAAHGVTVYPGVELPPRRMALTLAALGPRPVVELHAAGLKVGELLAKGAINERYKGLLQELVQP